jgi:glycosyltransferase involved in cell wall biosynthesis
MRILYSHRIGSRDGQSVHIEELVAALRDAGHQVLVVGPGIYKETDFGGESRLVSLVRQLLPRAVNELAELAYNIPAYLRLRREARSFSPDLIYERYNLFFLAGTLLARRCGLPLYLEVNSPLADERGSFGGLTLARLARGLERVVWRSADRVLAVTGVLKDIIVRAGVAEERVMVTPNGIEPARFDFLPLRAADPKSVVLGFIGFVREWHGLNAVIEAIASYRGTREVKLVVVGDGPARPALEKQAATLGIADRVAFAGLADRADIPGLVAGFDIALQPKVVSYASPLKLFEYMAAGRAIVAPDQENIREILTDGETALLFDPARPGAMLDAIARLLADPALSDRLGTAARREIERCDYTWAANARRIIESARLDLGRRRAGSARPGLVTLGPPS